MRGTKNLKILLVISCPKLETVTFERQHQYSLLFGRFEADQRKVSAL